MDAPREERPDAVGGARAALPGRCRLCPLDAPRVGVGETGDRRGAVRRDAGFPSHSGARGDVVARRGHAIFPDVLQAPDSVISRTAAASTVVLSCASLSAGSKQAAV